MPARIPSAASKRRTRMDGADYLMICAREVLKENGDHREPQSILDLAKNYGTWVWDEAYRMRTEMFGYQGFFCTRYDDLEPLSTVKLLTLQESAIAERPDISHAEKIEAIRPLREKRVARYSVRMGWDAAHDEVPGETIVPQTFEQRIGEEDAILARGMGVSLD